MQNLIISSTILATTLASFHPNGKVVSPRELLKLHGGKQHHHRALSQEIFANMTFDGSTDQENRELKVRNNFFSFSWYTNDQNCEMAPSDVHGYLVNYCFNIGSGHSFIIKINKKEEFYVELDYENDNCHGVPSAIYDMGWYPFGECGDAGFPGATVKFEYLSEYPNPMYTGMNQYTSEMYLCDSGNFNTFNTYTTGVCGVWGEFSLKVSDCDAEGGASFDHYDVEDTTCSGAIMETFPHTALSCSTTPTDDDYLFPQEDVLYSAKCETVSV